MVSKKQQVNAVNDSTITSSISWWHGWHLFHCISPMSLQDRTIFTDKQHLATDLARLPRTVSPGEQWCTLICERSEWFHKNKFDIMMAWMTPVSLHFSDVSTGSNNLYRLTTLGYWFSTFATNSLSRRTVVQINFCPPHSVPCATWPANLPAATRPPRHRGDCAKGARQVFSQAATGRHPLQSSCNPRRAKHIKPQRFDWCLQSNGRARAWIRPWSLPAWTVSRVDWQVKSQFFLSFWRPTSISCERVAIDNSKSQFFLSFWRPTSISCVRVAIDTSKVAIFPQFLTSNVHFVRKGCARPMKVAIFSSVFDVQRPFRAKGLRATNKSCNFSSVFDVQRPFRAKGLRATDKSRNFSSVFDVQRPFRAKGLRATDKSRNFSSVFDVQRPFRAKGLPGTLQNRNFT